MTTQRYEIGMVSPGIMGRNLNSDRSAWLPANSTPAQREYFGAHSL
ncbi:MAG: hypothetical protein ABI955_11895 [Nitrospirota bacterium]